MQMLEEVKNQLCSKGVVHVTVMPYPYRRGHFRLDYGFGKHEFAFLTPGQCGRAFKRWAALPLPSAGSLGDWPALIAYTCARQAATAEEDQWEYTREVRHLARLCMDSHRPDERKAAARLLQTLRAKGEAPWAVRCCALCLAQEEG